MRLRLLFTPLQIHLRKVAFYQKLFICLSLLFTLNITAQTPADLPWPATECGILAPGTAAITCGTVLNVAVDDRYTFGLVNIDGAVGGTRSDETANFPQYHHPTWHIDSIGNVFGIAYNNNNEILLTSSSNYGSAYWSQTAILKYGSIGGGNGTLQAAGAIYIVDPITGQASYFTSLPQQSTSMTHYDCEIGVSTPRTGGVGLGNIVYDECNDQYFVTNIEDGRIYRLDAAGNILDSYDPGIYDDGAAGISNLEDLAYGLALEPNCGRLFYGGVDASVHAAGGTTNGAPGVYSIDLDANGGFVGTVNNTTMPAGATYDNYVGTETLHSLITTGGGATYTVNTLFSISDLEFDPDGNLLVGVRVGCQNSFQSSYNHWGETSILTVDTGTGLYNATQADYDISVTGDAGNDDGYGGVTYYQLADSSVQYGVTSADILMEDGPHGIAIFNADASTTTQVTPLAAISYGTVDNTGNGDPKGVGGDIEIFSTCCPKFEIALDTNILCQEEPIAITLEADGDDVDYALYYSLIDSLDYLEVYQGTIGNPTLITINPTIDIPTGDSIHVENFTFPINTSDTIQTYYVYGIEADSVQIPFCKPTLRIDSLKIYPATKIPELEAIDYLCLDDAANNSNVTNLNDLISMNETEMAIWTDIDGAGGLVDSVFTASIAGTFRFVYTIPGIPGADPSNACANKSDTLEIEVRPQCCPDFMIVPDANPICIDSPFEVTTSGFIQDTINYIIYYSADSLLTTQEVYDNVGTTVLVPTFDLADGEIDSTFVGLTLPPNATDSIETYHLYLAYADTSDRWENCPIKMASVEMLVYPQTLTAVLTDTAKVCLSKQAENSHIIDLSTLIVSGETTGTWSDTDVAGGLVGSVFTASTAGTYTFTYTIAGMPGDLVGSPCYDNTYTTEIIVKDQCCPDLNSVTTVANICTEDAQAGPVDITLNHSTTPENLAIYYSLDTTLTATDLYGSPFGGTATAINTDITPTGASTVESGFNFPPNMSDTVTTYCIYFILAESNTNIEADCMPMAKTSIDIYPIPNIAGGEIFACDNNDGTGDFMLEDADTLADVDGGNTVTYYSLLTDAEIDNNPLMSPYVVMDGTTVYTRVENQYGCYRTDSILLTLLASPILNNSSIEECDRGDGMAEFDLSGVNSYYTTFTDAEGEINPLASQYLSVGELIYIRVNATNGCFTIREVMLVVLPLPNVADAQLEICDDGSGMVDFTLTDANVLVDLDGGNTVTYHSSQIQAIQGIFPVASPYNSAGNESLYIRVEDVNGCVSIAQLSLVINPLPQIAPASLQSCDNGDGTADFTLTDADALVDPIGTNTVSYHVLQSDADANINPLSSPYTSIEDTVYARVETASNCYLTTQVALEILPLPALADADLHVCDDGDGNVDFMLTDADALIDTVGGNTVSYHPFLVDAQSNTNPLASPYASMGEIVFARVMDGNGCVQIAELELIVQPLPTANPIEILGCDNGDGTADFQLTLEASNIDGDGGNMVMYYLTQTDADAGTNALSNPYNATDGLIYSRVEDAFGCYSTAEITLSVQASPILTNTEIRECDRGDGTAEFDLSALGITYYPSILDAEGETNPVGNSYTTMANDTLYSRVNATNGCYTIAEVVLLVLPPPPAENIVINACDDGDGTADIDLNTLDAMIDTTGNNDISYYATDIDAFLNSNMLSNPYTTSGLGEVIFARVQDGDGCFTIAEVTFNIAPNPIALMDSVATCDDGDGMAQFDLTAFNVDSLGGNMVTFHATQTNADAGINPLPSPYESTGGTIFVRIATANNCFDTAEIILTVLASPMASPAEMELCDDGDGTVDFDLSSLDATVDITTSNTVTYHSDSLDATTATNALTSPYASSGGTLFARVESANGCFDVSPITLTVNPLPSVATAMLELCDDGNGIVDFNLTDADATIDTTETNAITYHASLADADANINPLASPYMSSGETLYVRVETADACYLTTTLELIVLPLPNVASTSIEVCDDGDGSIDFTVEDAIGQIDLDSMHIVTFHTMLDDANDGVNAVSSPYSSMGEILFARVESANGCFVLATLELEVLTAPILENAELQECDLGDGTAEFDLSSGSGDYYVSFIDAENETNPLGSTYTTATTTIYLRVNATNGCYDIAEIALTVLPTPELANYQLNVCKDNDGIVDFDLSEADAFVSPDANNILSYHVDVFDAITGNNPVSGLFASSGQTLFVRVETPEGCYSIAELVLFVEDCCLGPRCIPITIIKQ